MQDTHNVCLAPCIINIASAYVVVQCTEKSGHVGPHTFSYVDKKNRPVSIQWTYVKQVPNVCGISYAPYRDRRCKDFSVNLHLPKIVPVNQDAPDHQALFISSESGVYTGFCCEKPSDHEDSHLRSGVCEQLGIVWKVSW